MFMVISLLVDVHGSSSREGPGLLTDRYFRKFTSSVFTLSVCVQISQCTVLVGLRPGGKRPRADIRESKGVGLDILKNNLQPDP